MQPQMQVLWNTWDWRLAYSKKARFLLWEKFLEIIHDCVDLNVDQVCFSGGEPTLHPLFREMMQHMEQQPVYIKLFTNATFPLGYCSDVIKGDHVVINLSAVTRKQYRELHGEDLFEYVIANIKRLVSLRNAGKPGFVVEIAYIVNALNIDQKQKMHDLASRLGVDSIHFKKMERNVYNREIVFPDGSIEAEEKRTPPVCLNGWFFMLTNADDNTRICPHIDRMRMGNFNKSSLKQIWLSTNMMNIRLLGRYGRIQKMFKGCLTCPFYNENIRRSRALVRKRR